MHAKTSKCKNQLVTCPYCRRGKLSQFGHFYDCPLCGSIYRQFSNFPGLERLNVNPVSNISSYPEVIIDPETPYCDCRVKEYLKTAAIDIGPQYCPRHNVIVVEGLFDSKDLEKIAEVTVFVINHETLHWILCKNFDESTSLNLDKVPAIPQLI